MKLDSRQNYNLNLSKRCKKKIKEKLTAKEMIKKHGPLNKRN